MGGVVDVDECNECGLIGPCTDGTCPLHARALAFDDGDRHRSPFVD